MKKSLVALGLTLAISAFSAHAQRHEGPRHHHQSTSTINLVIDSVDDSNAANLQAQVDQLEVLRAELGTLVDADQQDQAAISVAHETLKLARDTLRTDIDALLANDSELKNAVRDQMETERNERHLVASALRIDANFDLLVAAASEEQAAQLVANQLALDATREAVAEAREAGSDRSEIKKIKAESRETFESQRELAALVIASSEELSTELEASSESMRPPRKGGKKSH